MTPMELVGVRVEIPANTPMVLLQEQYPGAAGGELTDGGLTEARGAPGDDR